MPYFLQRLSAWIRRPQTGVTPAFDFENKSRTLAFLLLFGSAIVLFSFLFYERMQKWEKASPLVPIAEAQWKLRTCESSPCSDVKLWTSKESRFAAPGILRQKPKKDFWVGAEISGDDLKRAQRAGANELILGWAYGDFEVWINGVKFTHVLVEEKSPVIIPLPPEYLKHFLRVALLIHPSSEMGTPDTLAKPWTEGLATEEQALAFRSAAMFWKTSRPFALFFLNALFSILFFLFWSVQKQKQEYVYFAIYGAISTLVQLRLTDLFHGRFTASETWLFDLFLYFGEGTFGLLMALSFARARREIFQWGTALALILPWMAYLPLDTTNALRDTNTFLKQWYVPSAHLFGAAVCLLEAWSLQSMDIAARKIRVPRLLIFALGMTLIAVFYCLQANDWISPFGQAISSRFANFVIVFLLAGIAMREYRQEKWLLERVHISSYHRMNPLPNSIRGTLLSVDIKNSERLFQISAGKEMENLVETCLSHLWSAVTANGGIVLTTEGDGLKAFFDKSKHSDAIVSALRTIDQMKARLNEYQEQLQYQEIANLGSFEFRAGIASGEIKPTWQQRDGLEVAGWIDCGDRGPFLESVRLMELERQFEKANESVAVLNANESKSVTDLKGHWIFENHRVVGKHNRIFIVSAYQPAGKNAKKLKLVA